MTPFASRLLRALQVLAITFWAGSLWATGLLVAPVLFNMLDDRTLAGNIAGRLFELTVVVAVASSCIVLASRLILRRARSLREPLVWLVVVTLGLALLGQFGIQPVLASLREQALPLPVMQSELRGQFAAWHGVAGAVYLVQCVLAAALVLSVHRDAD